MMEVQVAINEKELDCIIEWFKVQTLHCSMGPVDIDAVLNIVLMKTCIKNAIPFHVKVLSNEEV